MTFDDLLVDIEKLKGILLQSIKAGAEIRVVEVNCEEERIEVETAKGQRKSRPFSELRAIWAELCKNPAAHVDSVLRGSGSSRNQPETILANLPYVEWFKFEQRKHLALIGRETHAWGSLKQMDDIHAEGFRQRLSSPAVADDKLTTVIVVASDIRQAAIDLESATGLPVEPIECGVYQQTHSGFRVLLIAVSATSEQIEPGTYIVMEGKAIPEGSVPVQVGDQTLYTLSGEDIRIMVAVL